MPTRPPPTAAATLPATVPGLLERAARPHLERLWERYPRSYEPSAIVAGWLTTFAVAGAAALVGLGMAAAVR